MKYFWDERQRNHAPTGEYYNGGMQPASERPDRVDAILRAIDPTERPADHGLEPIRRVHSAAYLDLLRSAHAEWLSLGRERDAFPYTFPLVGRRRLDLKRLDGRLGQHSFDTSTPIGPKTWEAAYWSAQTALSALAAVLAGNGPAFALCRPPGHHAGADYLGGYCYLANAAIAADEAIAKGMNRVAILDVDYHHGNGTQDIFWDRGDVLCASIHADPATDYPFFWGYADERGEGDGEGATLNLPLPRGTAWQAYASALDQALGWIAGQRPDLLIVCYGADTHEADPISLFNLKTQDYALMARRIASLGLPTLVVMEGGYAVDALGPNVAEFLSGI